jgi:hypothetical protein
MTESQSWGDADSRPAEDVDQERVSLGVVRILLHLGAWVYSLRPYLLDIRIFQGMVNPQVDSVQ